MNGQAMHQGQAAGTTWDPAKYGTFADHRLRPGLELLDRIPLADPKLIYDLGCGPGDLTRIVADRWPDATVIGVDNSPEMLEKAASVPSRIEWVEADVAAWKPELPPDLIFSNA